QAEGIACYRILIRGLLDITDNYVVGGVQPPANVVRHDGDDPYLVVAADKGTATFSDIANALAQEYGFWLDDAFASGGSAGYDHMKMAITARSASESVKRPGRRAARGTPTDGLPGTPARTCGGVRRGPGGRAIWGRGFPAPARCRASHPRGAPPPPPATSSSTPRPILRRAGPSASACSTCR